MAHHPRGLTLQIARAARREQWGGSRFELQSMDQDGVWAAPAVLAASQRGCT